MYYDNLYQWSKIGKDTKMLNTHYYKQVLVMKPIKKTYFIHEQNNVGIEHKRNHLERSKYLVGFN